MPGIRGLRPIIGRALAVGLLGGGSAALLPFSDNFNRADGAIGGGWNGATWTISTNTATNTPTTTGNELLTDGDMEAAGVASWTPLGTPTALEKVASPKHAGSQALHSAIDAVGEGAYQIPAGVAANNWYLATGWIYRPTGAAAGPGFRVSGSGFNASSVGVVAYDTWEYKYISGWTTATTPQVQLRQIGNTSGDAYADDYSFKQLLLSSLFCTRNFGNANVTAQCAVSSLPATNVAAPQAGLVLNLDSQTSPLNYVVAYVDRTTGKAYLDKCAGGSMAAVVSGAVTWGAAKVLKLVKNGTTYQLFYDGAQIGADQTITGMTGTYHGLFSTGGGATLDSYSILATPF